MVKYITIITNDYKLLNDEMVTFRFNLDFILSLHSHIANRPFHLES